MLADLPVEILLHICRYLGQGDLVNLTLTNRHFFEVANAKLYEAVVVDSSKRLFEEFEGKTRHHWFISRGFLKEPTVIRSLYALTKFLRNLTGKKEYGRYLRCLVVEDEFPDMPELELTRFLQVVFPRLINVEVLNWYAVRKPLDAKILALLPHPEHLRSLCGNFQLVASEIPALLFTCLRQFDLSNVTSHRVLEKVELDMFPCLESLTLAKKPSRNMLHFTSRVSSCCQSALSNTAESLPYNDPLSYISSLFSRFNGQKLQLTSLVLKDITLSSRDAYLLMENVDIPNLQKLSLDNCGEALFGAESSLGSVSIHSDSFFVRRRTPPSELFLDVLASQLTGLTLLNLNLYNELCFNRSTFVAISKLLPLKHLGVHIKVFKSDGTINLAPLIDSLQPHANSLEYLNLCCDVVETSVSVCPKKNNRYMLKSILGLSNLRRLKVLKLPLSFSQISDVANVLSPLESLQLLQLGITDLACTKSKAACSSCNDTLIYALYNTNCLISQDYFNCPSSFTSKIEQNKTLEYGLYSQNFKSVLPELQYLRFDLKSQSLLYDCRDATNVMAKDSSLIESFDSLVQNYI